VEVFRKLRELIEEDIEWRKAEGHPLPEVASVPESLTSGVAAQ
jgi:hypothetical protein